VAPALEPDPQRGSPQAGTLLYRPVLYGVGWLISRAGPLSPRTRAISLNLVGLIHCPGVLAADPAMAPEGSLGESKPCRAWAGHAACRRP